MKRFRFRVEADVFFEIDDCETEEEATAKAKELAENAEHGTTAAVFYPDACIQTNPGSLRLSETIPDSYRHVSNPPRPTLKGLGLNTLGPGDFVVEDDEDDR